MKSTLDKPTIPKEPEGRPPRRTLWIGSAGTAAAVGIVRSVREVWGRAVTVIAADINPPFLVGGAIHADLAVQVLPVADVDFESQLVSELAKHRVDTYIPLLDEEVLLAATWQEAGTLPPDLVVLAPGAAAVKTCFDKLATAEWLRSRGVATPSTVPAAEATWADRAMVFKPRCGRGSIDVRVVTDPQDMERFRHDEALVAQELCDPPEVTLDAFRSRSGNHWRVVCRERVEVKAGVCTKGRLFEDQKLAALAIDIGTGLGLTGAFCIQVMQGPERSGWQVTDVNPRIGAGARLTAAAGVDIAAAALADLWGEDPAPFIGPLHRECHVIRTYQEWVT